MRSSSRFAVAVHVMTVLAYKAGSRVSSDFLAASVNTNPVIIRRLLLALQKTGLVETRQGPSQGTRLARSPDSIDLAQIYRAVEEEEPFGMPPRKPNQCCPVGQCIEAVLEQVFGSAQAALVRELSGTTLGDLLRKVKGDYAGVGRAA